MNKYLNIEKFKKFSPAAIAILFFILAGFVITFHEMWRDEMQAYLVSRDNSSIFELFKNVKYEGKPILWYLLVRFANTIYNNVHSMQFLSVFISSLSVYIFIKNSPFRLWQKLLFVFGFFQFYEYTILSRDYCLQILLLFIFASLYFNKIKNYKLLSCVLILLSFVNPYALIAAGALFFGLIYEYIFISKKLLKKTQATFFIILTSIGMLAAIYNTVPASDIGHDFNNIHPFFGWSSDYFNQIKNAFILGFITLPIPGVNSWDGSNILEPNFVESHILPLIILLHFYTFFLLRNNKTLLIVYLIFISTFILFNYSFFHTGSQRHFGLLFIFWMLIIWMDSYTIKKTLFKNFFISIALSCFLFIQFIGNIQATLNEVRYKFSHGENLAFFLEKNNFLNENYIVSAYPDWAGLSSIGYLSDKTKYYYYNGRILGTYNIGDSRRLIGPSFENLLCEIHHLTTSTNKHVVLIIPKFIYDMKSNLSNLKPIYISEGGSIVAEDFVVLLIHKTTSDEMSQCNIRP